MKYLQNSSFFTRQIVRYEPAAARVDASQAETMYNSLAWPVRRLLHLLYPYVQPPSVFTRRGFAPAAGLKFDNSLGAARLRSLALSQPERLARAARQGKTILAAAQDVGLFLPFFAAAKNSAHFIFDTLGALYGGAAVGGHELRAAEELGIRREACPIVKGALGMLVRKQVPKPALIIAGQGATCDDHGVQLQLKDWLGYRVHWFEIPYRRAPLPFYRRADMMRTTAGTPYQTGLRDFVRAELAAAQAAIEEATGTPIYTDELRGILARINRTRRMVRDVMDLVSRATLCPLPAFDQLLLQIATIDHYGDFAEGEAVFIHVLELVRRRAAAREGVLARERPGAPRLLWMVPVVDMALLSMVEDAGGRIVAWELPVLYDFDYNVSLSPLEAMADDYLNLVYLGDPSVRLDRLGKAVVRHRVGGVIYASPWSCTHMPLDANLVKEFCRKRFDIPVLVLDTSLPGAVPSGQMRTRIDAFVETVRGRCRGEKYRV